MHVQPHMTIKNLKSLIRKTQSARLARRYNAIHMATQGQSAPQIAHHLCVSPRSVQEWVHQYNQGGPEALVDKPKQGQPKVLTPEQEAEVVKWLEDGIDDKSLSALNGPIIRDRIEEVFNKSVALSTIYLLMHRLGFECLRPRPQHRKSEQNAIYNWKREAPLLSRKSAKPTRTNKSKSGSRMKRGSVSRAR